MVGVSSMRLWREWHIGNPKNATRPYKAHILLRFERTRVLWTEFGSAPIWAEGRIIWKKASPSWQRLQFEDSTWWFGQNGFTVAIVGRGQRPPTVITQGEWHGILPPGRGSCSGVLSSDRSCTVRFREPKPDRHQRIAR